MPQFEYRFTVLVHDQELDGDPPATIDQVLDDLSGYLDGLEPTVAARRVDTFTDPVILTTGDTADPARGGWVVTMTGVVEAEFSDPKITGSDPRWEQSAQAVVDASSWTGAEHGWGWGSETLLDIAEPGQLPPVELAV